jgi:HTH-type transcriptional regulator/antitoxin HigA
MTTKREADRPATPSPGDFIKDELKVRGWTQEDLARILGRPLPTVNEIIKAKRAVMPEMAVALGGAFGTPPEIWMQREAAYRLSLVTSTSPEVRKRARLFELAPVKDMQRRGWIKATDDPEELEREVLKFLEIASTDEVPSITAAMRKSAPEEALTPAQRAWCFRVKAMAKALTVATFSQERLDECGLALRKLAAYPKEARKAPHLLASYGVRFVVVEPLPGSKVDGVTLWLDPSSPVIGMSLRFDRIDNFWHTLCHEFSHVKHGDALSVDTDLTGQGEDSPAAKSPVEERADREAAGLLIPTDAIESFVRRVGPMYSKERINQFANRVKIHPGIIVGQLQRRDEIGYSANREMLVKVRDIVAPAAVTDGWGHTIDPRTFS